LLEHNHEEADTLMILQAKNVYYIDRFSEVYISSSDTDAFLLLIYFYPKLCYATIFRLGEALNVRDINIGKNYECLGPEITEGILGFHLLRLNRSILWKVEN